MKNKIIFFWFLMISIMMALSSSFWFSLWMSLEINMMMFIPLMNSKNFLSSNSMLFYYIIQSLSSSLYFFSSIIFSIYSNNMMIFIMTISMLIKLGSAPFHMWFPQISEGLNFMSFFVLSSFQKIIPLHVTSLIMNNNNLIPFIILSSIMGSLGGLNQISFKKILAFSSIAHLSWILTLISLKQNFWTIYFLIYSIILMKITFFLNKNNCFSIIQINSMKMTYIFKLFLFSFFMSLGGIPPFLGFFIKLISIFLIFKMLPLILMFLIMSSLINVYFYMRSFFPLMLNTKTLTKTFLINVNNFSLFFFIFNFAGIILIFPMISFI
uniref:NADH-ubiquinone oxidoreductase chain 2 n=1 Tax=Ixodes columnae TaxID=1338503 RepID=A0A977TPX8_9ACAR|nr:NADH dehydrogenase subunit 2 [Ixodes kuntzi]YP_010534090.1 NADH dehydrogenase subunit 2 [Ixodes columnae]UNO53637.1 NADH dehydrogenase subunit 2 [Ixodes kuntzi]UXX50302.1 NADH dehydrogenase subunit 2 [Ixodes columnae]